MRRLGLLIPSLLIISLTAAAQLRVAADVEVKTLYGGKVSTVNSKVFCSSSGHMVQVFDSPDTYYTLTNPNGEFKLYFPSTNEVYSERKEDYSDRDNLLYLFISGRSDVSASTATSSHPLPRRKEVCSSGPTSLWLSARESRRWSS